MAATRKSAKRTKKRAGKGASGRKRAGAKSATKRSAKKAGRSKKRTTRSASPLKTVRAAGEKTWEALKSTTAQVVEGVKGTFGGDENPNGR